MNSKQEKCAWERDLYRGTIPHTAASIAKSLNSVRLSEHRPIEPEDVAAVLKRRYRRFGEDVFDYPDADEQKRIHDAAAARGV